VVELVYKGVDSFTDFEIDIREGESYEETIDNALEHMMRYGLNGIEFNNELLEGIDDIDIDIILLASYSPGTKKMLRESIYVKEKVENKIYFNFDDRSTSLYELYAENESNYILFPYRDNTKDVILINKAAAVPVVGKAVKISHE